MIPKKIHYIWLGNNPLPKIAKKCIASWKKYCPDYEIKRWDESNLNIDCCQYCREAYDAKKYAFASDVLRFDVLSKEGGIYLDIDVELLKPLDQFLSDNLFCGFENDCYVAPGLILGTEPNNIIISDLLIEYKDKHFAVTSGMKNQETICAIFTKKLVNEGLLLQNKTQRLKKFSVYASEYFCPKSMSDGKIYKTENTFSIHHYASTWVPKYVIFENKCKQFIKRILGPKIVNKIKEGRYKNGEKS